MEKAGFLVTFLVYSYSFVHPTICRATGILFFCHITLIILFKHTWSPANALLATFGTLCAFLSPYYLLTLRRRWFRPDMTDKLLRRMLNQNTIHLLKKNPFEDGE